MKSVWVTVIVMGLFSTGLAIAQVYPTPYITLFTGTPTVQPGNAAIGGTFGAGTSNGCTATSGVPCSGNTAWLASGTSTAATPIAVPSACQNPTVTRNSSDSNTTGSVTVATTSSPYPNTLVITKVYPSAQPTATAAVNFACN